MDKNVRNYICIFLARKFKSILLIFSLSTCRTFVTGGLEKVRKGVKVMVCKIRKKVTSTARLPPQCLKNLKKSHFFNIHQSHAFQKNIWIFCAQNKHLKSRDVISNETFLVILKHCATPKKEVCGSTAPTFLSSYDTMIQFRIQCENTFFPCLDTFTCSVFLFILSETQIVLLVDTFLVASFYAYASNYFNRCLKPNLNNDM